MEVPSGAGRRDAVEEDKCWGWVPDGGAGEGGGVGPEKLKSATSNNSNIDFPNFVE